MGKRPKTDQKVKQLLADAAGADHELLRMRDLLVGAFRVSAAGVDVTRHAAPRLEPELEAAKRRRKR